MIVTNRHYTNRYTLGSAETMEMASACKSLSHGAWGGNRTPMPLRAPVFETDASANSATQACGKSIRIKGLRVHAEATFRQDPPE